MRKTITLLIALLALTVSTWAQVPTVTWDQSTIQTIDVDRAVTPTQTIGSTISVTATAPDESECWFGISSISIKGNGEIIFSPASGQLTSVVISCPGTVNITHLVGLGTEWIWDNNTLELTWTGSAASVALECDGSSDGIYLGNIYSIDFTVVGGGAASSVTWNETDVDQVALYLSPSYVGQTISASPVKNITASLTRTSAESNDCQFSDKRFHLVNNGNVTFTSSVGDISRIVITCSGVYGTFLDITQSLPTGWEYNSTAQTFTWEGTPASAVSISGNLYFDITSIEFTLDNGGSAPAELTTTWEARQVSHVRFDGYNEDDLRSSGVIKNIIASHERTDAGNCSFQNGQLWMENNGYVKFKSIAGNLTDIVIRCSDLGSPSNLSDGWSSQSAAKTLTWTGDAEEVTLRGNIGCTISSIEFTYTPADAQHVGETFEQAYQLYEITGAHTAKVPAQSFGGSFRIPEYVDYDEVRYYITEIDDYAFYDQDDLSDITGGVNIARIGAHACEGCTHMRSFSLDGGVLDAIGVDAFKNCKLLAYYESNTTTPPVLGNNVFAGDEWLHHILIDYYGVDAYKEAAVWSAYESIIDYRGIDASVGEKFFDLVQMYAGLYEVTTPATYGTPGEAKVVPYTSYINNIYPITRTGTLVIPEDANYMGSEYAITGIGENAYKDSTRFNAVMIPQQVTSIEAGAFLNCTGVENVYFLWENPNTITWYDRDKGLEFATATSGKTKIYVPKGKLAAYQSWAPAWASRMFDVELFDVDVTKAEDPNHSGRFYRTFFDSENDYLMPPSVWAHVGYVENNQFILRSIAYDGQILPKNTAVVLESETPIYHLIKSEGSAPAYTGQNDLRGKDVNFAVSSLGADADKVYVLNREAKIGSTRQVGMGMYKYTGTTLGAHKAYLIYDAPAGPNSAPIRFLFNREEQAEGFENVQNNASCSKILRDGQLIIVKGDREYNAQGLIIK